MSIIVKILFWLLAAILLFLGIYLWKHRKKQFIIFHPEKIHSLSIILTIMSIALLILGIITLFMSFSSSLMSAIIIMLIDVGTVSILSFILIGYSFGNF